jgi:TP901 family phage tail tape measure protein
MAVDQLKLQVVLGMVDKASGALDKISFGSRKAADALKTTRDAVKKLEDQQKLIDNYQRARESIVATNAKNIADRKKRADLNDRYEDSRSEQQDRQAQVAVMRTQYKALLKLKQKEPETAGITAQLFEASKKLERLEKSYNMHSNRSRNLKSELSELDGQLKRNTEQHSAQVRQAIKVKKELHAAGLHTKALSGQQADLTAAMERANAAIDKQKANLAKLGALQAAHKKAAMHGAMLVGGGMAAQAAGGAIKQRMQTPINDFMAHEDAMMGIARQVQGARDSAGQLTAIYRTAEAEVRKLSTELPLTTVQIAEMMTAAARMEVPTNELAGFTKQVAHMAMAFDAVPDQIAESMGKVAKNFKIPLNQISGLADTINYLDDNAISKGADIIDYMNRVSGMAALAKMSSNDYAALGSTLLTLGERTESAGTATNAIVTKFAMASKGSKKFQGAMGELGLKSSQVEAGMATDAMGTLLTVMEKIKAMPEHKQLGIMAELVGQEHADTLAKLVNGTEELARQRTLANSAEAKGSMDREAAARKSALSAQMQMAKNRVFNLAAALGESLKPALVEVFNRTAGLLEGLQAFAQNNPGFVSAVMTGALALAGLLGVMGTVLVTVGPLWAAWATGALLFAKAVPLIALVKTALLGLGRAFLMSPIGLTIAAVAALAYGLYWLATNFAQVKAWAVDTFNGIWAAASASINKFLTLPQRVMTAFQNGGWTAIGGMIVDGLVAGLNLATGGLFSVIQNIAKGAVDIFKNALGIKSPSRVFAEIGGHVMGGLDVGLAKGEADPLARMKGAAAKLAGVGAGLTLGTAALAMPDLPNINATPSPLVARAGDWAQGPARSAAGTGAGAGSAGPISITIHAAPGMDPQAIAKAVAAELDRRDRAGRSRVRGSMQDID